MTADVDLDRLEAEAARAEARAAEARRLAREEQDRLAAERQERLEAFDRRFVDEFPAAFAAATEAEEEAWRGFQAAVAGSPVSRAWCVYRRANLARKVLAAEIASASGRVGQPMAMGSTPGLTDGGQEELLPAVEQAARLYVAREADAGSLRSEFLAEREAAGDAPGGS